MMKILRWVFSIKADPPGPGEPGFDPKTHPAFRYDEYHDKDGRYIW